MSQYGKVEFWQERYTKQPEPFDWYQVYSGIKDVITQHITKSDKILNVGAGNSRLSEEMYEEGYSNITNIEISPKCVSFMEDKLKTKCPNMTCIILIKKTR